MSVKSIKLTEENQMNYYNFKEKLSKYTRNLVKQNSFDLSKVILS